MKKALYLIIAFVGFILMVGESSTPWTNVIGVAAFGIGLQLAGIIDINFKEWINHDK